MKKTYLLLVLAIMFLMPAVTNAQKITRETLFRLPADFPTQGLLGLRYYDGSVYLLSSSGKYLKFGLPDNSISSGELPSQNPIIDFDVMANKFIYLDESGELQGHAFSSWKGKKFDACRIEAFQDGIMMYGSGDALYIPKNSGDVVTIPDMPFALPFTNGFFWTLAFRKDEGNWGADIYDCLGSIIAPIYEFSKSYNPVNIELGPLVPEDELLISGMEGGKRYAVCIGRNGRMFWKLRLPVKLCARDFVFDGSENLIIIEKDSDGFVLNRWSITFPEG